MRSLRCRRKEGKLSLVYPLNHRGWSELANDLRKNGPVTYYTAVFTFSWHKQRSEDAVSYYSMLQTGQDTQKTACCSAAFHHYSKAYTSPPPDIRLQLSQNQRYCTNTEKAQRGVVTRIVAFHTIIKLHFL